MKNKKGLIIGIIAIIAIIAIALVAIYFTTDLFKTNQQIFYKYISKTQIVNPNLGQVYNLANDKITKNSSSSLGELSLSYLASNPEVAGVLDVDNIFTIKENGLENKLLNQSYKDITISENEQNIITLKYLRDGNTYAIGADNILAKYLAVENANLKELFTKFGMEDVSDVPDSITNNYEEVFKIDKTTLDTLKATYYKVIYENINEGNFYKTKNEDGTETIGVSLTEQEIANIIKLILETAKNDNTLLNLIFSKAQLLGYTDVTIQEIQTYIQDILDEGANATYSTNPEFIKLSLIKKEKKVIGLEFEINIENPTNNTQSTDEMYNSDSAIEANDIFEQGQEFTQSQSKSYNKSTIKLDFSEENKIIISTKENGNEAILVTINYSCGESTLDFNINIENKMNEENFSPVVASFPTIKIQYQINGYNTDTINQNCTLSIINQNELQTTYQFNYTNNITLKQDVQIEKLTTDNSAKLNDMTAEQIQQLIIALRDRIVSLYGENLPGTTNQGIIDAARNAKEEYRAAE